MIFPTCLGPDPKPVLPGDTRTYRVWLDPNQYQKDMVQTVDGHEVCIPACFMYFPASFLLQ